MDLVNSPSALLARITWVIEPATGTLSTYANPKFKRALAAFGWLATSFSKNWMARS